MNVFDMDALFKEGKLRRLPELPKLEFKANKVKYSVTDLRYLNENAIDVFQNILTGVISERGIKEITFNIQKGTSENTLRVISDILMAMSYSAEKKGKNGYTLGGALLVTGCHRNDDSITFHLVKENAEIIFDYAMENFKYDKKINIYELVIEIADKSILEISRGNNE